MLNASFLGPLTRLRRTPDERPFSILSLRCHLLRIAFSVHRGNSFELRLRPSTGAMGPVAPFASVHIREAHDEGRKEAVWGAY